jgi:hypothetical protein
MKTYSREEAIDDLRRALIEIAGDEHSICLVAKEQGLFCHGFAQWKLHELKENYAQISKSHRHPTRDEVEDFADRWQLARQFAKGEALACDVQHHEEERFQTCKGWDEFSDDDLMRFHAEICGSDIEIV